MVLWSGCRQADLKPLKQFLIIPHGKMAYDFDTCWSKWPSPHTSLNILTLTSSLKNIVRISSIASRKKEKMNNTSKSGISIWGINLCRYLLGSVHSSKSSKGNKDEGTLCTVVPVSTLSRDSIASDLKCGMRCDLKWSKAFWQGVTLVKWWKQGLIGRQNVVNMRIKWREW